MHAHAVGFGVDGQGVEFTEQIRRRYRDAAKFCDWWVREHVDAVARLEAGPLAVFRFVLGALQLNEEAWWSQLKIGEQTGYSDRSVRDYLAQLSLAGLLARRRERQRDGHQRIYLRPGPVAVAAIVEWMRAYPEGEGEKPQGRAKHLRQIRLPEGASATLPEATSVEPHSLKIVNFSSREASKPLSPPADAESSSPLSSAVASQEEEAATQGSPGPMAREALALRYRRACPGQSLPAVWDGRDLAWVLACLRSLPAGEDGRQALADSIDGAFLRSKKGAPRARFIWSDLEHFHENRAAGAALRRASVATERTRTLNRERAQRSLELAEPTLSAEALAKAAAAALEALK